MGLSSNLTFPFHIKINFGNLSAVFWADLKRFYTGRIVNIYPFSHQQQMEFYILLLNLVVHQISTSYNIAQFLKKKIALT